MNEHPFPQNLQWKQLQTEVAPEVNNHWKSRNQTPDENNAKKGEWKANVC